MVGQTAQAQELRRPAAQRARPAEGQHAVQHGDAGRPHRGRHKFGKEEGMFLVKCDVHPWMSAYVGVFAQPVLRGHRARTASSRSRTCRPGTYEIEAWHEKLGRQDRAGDRRATASRPPSTSRSPRRASEPQRRPQPTRAATHGRRHGHTTPKPRPPTTRRARARRASRRARLLAQVRLLDRSQGRSASSTRSPACCSCSSASA